MYISLFLFLQTIFTSNVRTEFVDRLISACCKETYDKGEIKQKIEILASLKILHTKIKLDIEVYKKENNSEFKSVNFHGKEILIYFKNQIVNILTSFFKDLTYQNVEKNLFNFTLAIKNLLLFQDISDENIKTIFKSILDTICLAEGKQRFEITYQHYKSQIELKELEDQIKGDLYREIGKVLFLKGKKVYSCEDLVDLIVQVSHF